MFWTNEPPKERGWYWVVTNAFTNNPPSLVFVGYPEYDDRLHVYDFGKCQIIEEYCNRFERMWSPKVEVPEYDYKKDYVVTEYWKEKRKEWTRITS